MEKNNLQNQRKKEFNEWSQLKQGVQDKYQIVQKKKWINTRQSRRKNGQIKLMLNKRNTLAKHFNEKTNEQILRCSVLPPSDEHLHRESSGKQ